MAKLFIISDDWNPQPWFSTGGTRAKKYLQAPDGKFYYFKRSQYKDPTDTKPGKDFKYEFWSEVIASEVGSMLGFNLLKYDIAIDGMIMGCICESMINSEHEELIEGVKYLQAFAPSYEPGNKEHQIRYTFQLIENALENAKLKNEIEHIIAIIIFDSLIGNGDRHQENWALINQQRLMYEAIEEFENTEAFGKTKRRFRWLLKWIKKYMRTSHHFLEKKGRNLPKSFYISQYRFAPIYDSGSSLGRELTNEKVEEMLINEEQLNKYINRGVSEIHWEGKKLNHFELIRHLLESPYNEIIKPIIKMVIMNWDAARISQLVHEADRSVPESHIGYKIPNSRKQLIIKMITLRRNRLADLIHEGV